MLRLFRTNQPTHPSAYQRIVHTSHTNIIFRVSHNAVVVGRRASASASASGVAVVVLSCHGVGAGDCSAVYVSLLLHANCKLSGELEHSVAARTPTLTPTHIYYIFALVLRAPRAKRMCWCRCCCCRCCCSLLCARTVKSVDCAGNGCRRGRNRGAFKSSIQCARQRQLSSGALPRKALPPTAPHTPPVGCECVCVRSLARSLARSLGVLYVSILMRQQTPAGSGSTAAHVGCIKTVDRTQWVADRELRATHDERRAAHPTLRRIFCVCAHFSKVCT